MSNAKIVCAAALLAASAWVTQASAQCFYAPEYTNGPDGGYHNAPGTGSSASNPHCWQYGHDNPRNPHLGKTANADGSNIRQQDARY